MTNYAPVHKITVSKLRSLLAQLRDDDELHPNAMGNLKVVRDGNYVGFIDLLVGMQSLELLDAPEETR